MIYVFDRVENIVGKGQNAGYQHFLLFPQCFQKLSFSGSLKVVIVSEHALVFTLFAVQVFLKTLWEKEKLLATTNFSFFHSVSYTF